MAIRHEILLDIGLDTLTQARAALAEAPLSAPASADCAERSKQALAGLRRANHEEFQLRGLLAHAEALWRCGDAKAADDPLREAEIIAARGPMPLFMTDAHLLRARIALSQNNLAATFRSAVMAGLDPAIQSRSEMPCSFWMAASEGGHDDGIGGNVGVIKKAECDAAAELIGKHGYGRAAPEAAVLNAEIACAENAANRDAAIAAAVTAIRGETYHDERTGITIDGGWWGLLPRLELLLPAGDPRLADLRAARDAYNAERDAYLAAQEADLQAKLAKEWEEEDRALADPAFRRELSAALVDGYKFEEMLLNQRREAARQYLKQKREARSKKAAVKQKRGRWWWPFGRSKDTRHIS